jgi:hypothetical protein
MNNQTVILGWGSLIYQLGSLEENVRSSWHNGGPELPIEFSRISRSRDEALTLVIDPVNGVRLPTKYIISKRKDPKDTACDLRNREGTVIRKVGIIDLKENYENFQFPEIGKLIKEWVKNKDLRAVIWTDLESNFEKVAKTKFSIPAALEHLNGLSKKGKEEAKAYLKNAPEFINTPLRNKLIPDNWY